MSIVDRLRKEITQVVLTRYAVTPDTVIIERPSLEVHGDFSTNAAMLLASVIKQSPLEIARNIVDDLSGLAMEYIDKIEVANPGFVNFYLSDNYFIDSLKNINTFSGQKLVAEALANKKIMVEFAHPNTHKEMHIGHMRTLIVGEALSRLLGCAGAEVFRANYQGDIGPHVAKALWGTKKIIEGENMSWLQVEEGYSLSEKAHLLGQGYVRGNQEYAENEDEIKALNAKLYQRDEEVMETYLLTRKWSLEYYQSLYLRFGTTFDKLYFESLVADQAIDIVKQYVGEVFEESEGAIIFDGEEHGLHKRVFITQDGYPTYEAKDIALAKEQFADFQFDQNVHVVADEQTGYFKVVFCALSLMNPDLGSREYHLPMGMVNLKGLKMSSRTGVLVTVDGLLDEVKSAVTRMAENSKLIGEQRETMLEQVSLGAVKYSILKNDPLRYVLFDLEESINLEGNSGPYLQYTYARCQSVLSKSQKRPDDSLLVSQNMTSAEREILRWLSRYEETVIQAAQLYKPNLLCSYLFELAQRFNRFYNSDAILGNDPVTVNFRLKLTAETARFLKQGLSLLGIDTPERM